MGHRAKDHSTASHARWRLSVPSWVRATGLTVALVSLCGCSGKKRPFADEANLSNATSPDPSSGVDNGGDPESDDVGASEPRASGESAAAPATLLGISDAGSSQSGLLPASMASCGDACSGECTPGVTECSSLKERIECGVDALWAEPVMCPNVCLDGACAGECPPGVTECTSTTRFRSCSELGTWSEPADCENACVGSACGGECTPGETRCASTTNVQTCNDDGQWGQTTACQNACAGNACTGECVPGTSRCSSETQLQTCNDQGQFLAPVACQLACVNGACGGECSPGSRRCNPTNGVPQFCGGMGIWQSQAPCQFACSGSGTCTGECTPGSRRCNPTSGVPQLCSSAAFWQNQTVCSFICTNGSCGGECAPGSRRCDPASGVPQLCSNAAIWQNQAACARGCQNGACIPQLGLGLQCGSARDCTSGFCVDGVCCENSCGGVCAQCETGTGRCITPPTDPDCDPVTCASTECRASNGNITSNLCRARGQCKDQSDCRFSNFDRGTPCDTAASDHRFCDGSGNCTDPTLSCNGVGGRPVGENNVCCVRRAGGNATESYESTAACGTTGTQVTCDGDEDCRSGTVCCGLGAGQSFVSCVSTSVCNTTGPSFSYYEVCASPSGFSDDCPSGSVCRPLPNFLPSGWAQCAPPL